MCFKIFPSLRNLGRRSRLWDHQVAARQRYAISSLDSLIQQLARSQLMDEIFEKSISTHGGEPSASSNKMFFFSTERSETTSDMATAKQVRHLCVAQPTLPMPPNSSSNFPRDLQHISANAAFGFQADSDNDWRLRAPSSLIHAF